MSDIDFGDDEFDDEFSDDGIFTSGDTLLIDGDILVYRPCCIFEDEDVRSQELIMSNIDGQVDKLCSAAGVSKHNTYLTTKKNFRDFIVDDYKANRIGTPRPKNLAFAKKYMVKEHGATYVPYLEADDLLAINQKEDTIIWSLDKDLKQVPGKHLNADTKQVSVVDDIGEVWKDGKKIRFTGFKGLMLQTLTGDGADWIVGCGTRSGKLGKSGFNARQGIGPAKAMKFLNDSEQTQQGFIDTVVEQYKIKFEEDWQVNLENQANLLFMVNTMSGNFAKRWTYDGRDEYMDITTGKIVEVLP